MGGRLDLYEDILFSRKILWGLSGLIEVNGGGLDEFGF